MLKNTAGQKVTVLAWDTAADEPKTGDAANITAYVSKDGGAAVQTNDVNPTELSAANMKGAYQFDMTQAESNADLLDLLAASATANVKLDPVSIYTIDPASYKADVSGLATSAALATHDGNLAVVAAVVALESTSLAIKAKTDLLPADPAGVSDLAALALEATAQLIKAKTDNLPASPAATGAEMALTAAALTAIANEIRDSKWTAGGVATVGFLLRCINSMAKGNFYKTGNVYKFYDDDDTGSEDGTLLFTLTNSALGDRTNI